MSPLASISHGTSEHQCMGAIHNSQMSSEHPQDEAQPSNTYLIWLSVSIHSQLLLTQLSTAHSKHLINVRTSNNNNSKIKPNRRRLAPCSYVNMLKMLTLVWLSENSLVKSQSWQNWASTQAGEIMLRRWWIQAVCLEVPRGADLLHNTQTQVRYTENIWGS